MKKFKFPIPDGGAPMFSDTVIAPLFDDIYKSIQSSLANIAEETQGIICSGCVVTPNGGNFDCSAGIVFLNGQFMDFAGFTNQAATRYIVQGAIVDTSFPFFDGSTKALIQTHTATHQGSAPGGGQYISVSSTSPRRLTNYISPQTIVYVNNADTALSNAINNEASIRNSGDTTLQNNIDTEATTRGSADTNLQNQINALFNRINYLNSDDFNGGRYIVNGTYHLHGIAAPGTNNPGLTGGQTAVLVTTGNSTNKSQLLTTTSSTPHIWGRSYASSTWSAWITIV